MNLDKIYTDAEFANSVVPQGTRLVFLGYENGVSGTVTLRYKDSDGNFGNVVTSQQGGGGDASEYVLPIASANVLGGVKIGQNLTITADGILSATDTNTTYTDATVNSSGLMSASDKVKLNGLVNYEKNKGYYATASALTSAHPTANNGDYAIVGDTDTVWIWDSDSSAWKNSGGSTSVATAENTTVADAGNHFSSSNVEGCLAELAESMDTLSDDFSSILGEIATSLAEI
jgi:hypothetical protein